MMIDDDDDDDDNDNNMEIEEKLFFQSEGQFN